MIKTSIFNRKPAVTQSVAATVVRTKTSRRGIGVSSSYTIGTSKRRTFVRQAIASASNSIKIVRKVTIKRVTKISSSYSIKVSKKSNFVRRTTASISRSVQTTRRRAVNRSTKVSSSYSAKTHRKYNYIRRVVASNSMSIKIAKVKAREFLIVSNAIWKMSSNFNTKIIVPVKGLFKQNIFINSSDWQEPNNGQPVPGTGPEAFDDVPETITETDDELGTSTIPFHE
jgi:hypothetical protein